MGFVKFNGGGNVDIRQPVAIGEAKALFAFEIGGHPLQPAAGQRGLAGVNQGDAPVLGALAVEMNGVVGHVEGHVRHVQRVIGEIFLDHIAAKAAADDEIAQAVAVVELHDVPQDRPSADFHHRLRLEMGFFRKPGAQAAGKDDNLHDFAPGKRQTA